MDRQDPVGRPVQVDPEVIRRVSQQNRVAVYRTLGLVVFLAVAALVVGVLFSRSFENTSRIDKAVCIEIQFLDSIPHPNVQIQRLAADLKSVSRNCPAASAGP
jgi:ABC-type anion transport system duplicated permease subunit